MDPTRMSMVSPDLSKLTINNLNNRRGNDKSDAADDDNDSVQSGNSRGSKSSRRSKGSKSSRRSRRRTKSKDKEDEYRDPINPSEEILIKSHFLPPVLEKEQSEAMTGAPSSPFNISKYNKVGIEIDKSVLDQSVESTTHLNSLITTEHRVHACLLVEDETLNSAIPPIPCIACCGDDVIVYLYNVNNGLVRRKYRGSSEGFFCICISPFCMSNSSDQRSRSNSVNSVGSYRSSATNNSEMPKSGILQYLVGGGMQGGLYVWDFQTSMVLQYINTSSICTTAAVSNGNLQMDPATLPEASVAIENSPIYGVALYMKRNRLHVITCSDQSTITCWDIVAGEKSHNFNIPVGENVAVSTRTSGYKINAIAILDPQQMKQSKNIAFVGTKGNSAPKLPVLLFAGGDDKNIHIWNAVTNDYIKALVGHKNDVTAVAAYFQSTTNALNTLTNQGDGQKLYNALIISGSKDKSVLVWDMNSGTIIHSLVEKGHASPITGVCYVFGGSNPTIISSSEDGIIKTWHSINGRLLKTIDSNKDFGKSKMKNTKLSGFNAKKGLLRGDPFKVIIGISSWNKQIVVKELDTMGGGGCTVS